MKYLCTWDADKWVWTVEPDDPDYDGFTNDGTDGQYHIEADNEETAILYAELVQCLHGRISNLVNLPEKE